MHAGLCVFLERQPKLTFTLVLLYAALIFSLSIAPAPTTSKHFDVPNIDLIGHFILYSGFGFLVYTSLSILSLPSLLLATAVSSFYGAAMEVCQMFIPGRNPSISDSAANLFGSLLGAFIALHYNQRKKP